MMEVVRAGIAITALLGAIALAPPRWLIRCFARRHPSVFFYAHLKPGSKKCVALTIDDVPSPNLSGVLKTMRHFGAHATLFVIGNYIEDERDHDNLMQAVQDGCELGNHMRRNESSFSLSLDVFESQLRQMSDTLSKFDDVQPPTTRWFRPGHGWFNTLMVDIVNHRYHRMALGSVYPHDPALPFTSVASAYVLARIQSGDIIILHDLPHLEQTLATILQELVVQRGYDVVTLSELKSRE